MPRSLLMIFLLGFSSVSFASKCEDLSAAVAAKKMKMGYLFSAISFAETPFGKFWDRNVEMLRSKFPGLEIKSSEALHITIIYIGGEWTFPMLEHLMPHLLITPSKKMKFDPAFDIFGNHAHVAGIHLHGGEARWKEEILKEKSELVKKGLKKVGRYDGRFNAHVTLGEIKLPRDSKHETIPPTLQQYEELLRFREWLLDNVSFDEFSFEVEAGAPVEIFLAGATRPEGKKYIRLEEFIKLVKENTTSP